MRVLVAPDKFAGTLTAVEAAEAIATGWRRRAPDDELDLAPMADGGPGFVDVLHAALGGELHVVTVEAVHGEQVPATVLRVGDTAYIESAQSCGLHLLHDAGGGAELASTQGVGELLLAAVDGRRDHGRDRARRVGHQRRRSGAARRARRHLRRRPRRRCGRASTPCTPSTSGRRASGWPASSW